MKKNLILLIINFVFINAYAQLKVFSGGNTIIGGLSAPVSGVKLHVLGNSVFSHSTSSIIYAPLIHGVDSADTTQPDFSWYNDEYTGMWHPAYRTIAFNYGGAESMRILMVTYY
jgi:hypothetical protein